MGIAPSALGKTRSALGIALSALEIILCALGIALIATPAAASITYKTTQGTFTSEAAADLLSVSSLMNFSAANLMKVGTVNNDEYIDPTTHIQFLLFTSSTLATHASFTVSGTALDTPLNSGDILEVTFPSNVAGFAFNFSTNSAVGETLCIDTSTSTFSTCAGSNFAAQHATAFLSATNDNPSVAPLPTLFLHPLAGNPDTDLLSFEVATTGPFTPDTPTLILIGSGLLGLGFLSRRRRST